MSGRRPAPWMAAAALLVLVLTGVGAGCGSPASSSHSGGDPGGRILRALEPVQTAIPSGASDVSTTTHASSYEVKCPDNPGGKSGWSPVTIYSTFRSDLPTPSLLGRVGTRLSQLGWHHVAPVWDRRMDQYQPLAEWDKTLFPGQTATATIYQLPAGDGPYSGSWHFGAVAKPPGYALPGC